MHSRCAVVVGMVAAMAVSLTGCFEPTIAEGLQCGSDNNCPPGQGCAADNTCRLVSVLTDAASDCLVSGDCQADANPSDASQVDASLVDAAAHDAALIDAALIDAALIDAALIDAALIDAALIDAALIDAAPATVTITSGPPNNSVTGPRVSFEFLATGASAECQVDGQAFVPCTSPVSYNLPDTTHSFTVRTTDLAASDGRDWEVVCTAPDPLPDSVGEFHFEEASGQVVTNDAAGFGDGVLGTTSDVEVIDPSRILAGRFGRGLDFSALEQDIVTLDLSSTSPFLSVHDHTIQMWVRPSGAGVQLPLTDPSQRISIVIINFGGGQARIDYQILDEANSAHTVNGAMVAIGEWAHVIATYGNDVQTLYVNGAASSKATEVGDTIDWRRVTLSRTTDDFGGEIDEVLMSSSGISSTQALQRYCPN